MNIKTRANKTPFYIIFGILMVFTVALLLFRPIMKIAYPVKYINLIEKYSDEYNLDKYMVMAVISAESKFDKDAVSHKNAKGLMQLKEETALWCMEQFNIASDGADIRSPELNINIGCAYLRYLTDKFKKPDTALAAYNAGEGNVSKWLEDSKDESKLNSIPFAETKRYVDTVNKRTHVYRYLYKHQEKNYEPKP